MPAQKPEVTQLLQDWKAGDDSALEKLLPQLLEELRARAHRMMQKERAHRQGAEPTLQTDVLVNEALLKFMKDTEHSYEDRNAFLAAAVTKMWRVLVDEARARKAQRRFVLKTELKEWDDQAASPSQNIVDILALDRALNDLEALDARKAKIVRLRYVSSFTVEETAAALDISPKTVKRDWTFAKAWLAKALKEEAAPKD